MKSRLRKLLAAIICLAMIFQLSGFALADSTVNAAGETSMEEETNDGSEPVEPSSEAAAEESSVNAQTEPAPESIMEGGYPAFESQKDFGDIKIYISAPEGAFPRGVKLSVTKVALSDADKQKLDEVVDSDQTIGDYVAFDIKFYDADDNEIQPNIPIEVRFELAADNILAGAEELEVFHIKDGAEPVEQIEDGSKDVVIEADSFSVYVVGVTTVLAAAASSAKSIKMNSDGGNVTQFIFVFNVYDKETGTIRTTTLHGQNHKQGNHLDREATFDDGNLGEWSIGDEIISVDVYDLSGNYLLTVLPAAFTHRSSGGVIQTDGTTFGDGGEILQLNGGTANFWFGGVSPIPGTKIVIEKIWIDQDGNEIVSLRNKNVTIIVESPLPSNADVVFGENKLPGTLVVPTNNHPTYGAEHTFSEVISSALPDGYDSSEYVRVEFNGVDQNSADGTFVLDTSTLTPDQTYTLTYVNKLTALPGKGQFTPKVEKILTGIASTEQIFNFSLVQVNALGEAVTGGITRTASTTAGNYTAGAQAVTFDEIGGLDPGTYYFKITETAGTALGWAYSTASYTITVTVAYNGDTMVTYPGGYNGTDNLAPFTNAYSPNSTTANFTASKIITGPYPLDMTAGQFSFAVKNGAGTIVAEATNDADGNIVFPKLTFTETGLYNYTIVETSTDGNGFSTDKAVYEASVTVTDAGGGELAASVSYKAGSAPAFTNAYNPNSVDANFTAGKIITGPYPLDMTAGQFGFAVKNGDGAIVAEATNDADGNIEFPKLTFTETGLYNYTIVETSTDGNGFRTDKTIYEASVTVTDAGGGELAASVSYKAGSAPAFTNAYSPNSVDANFTASKIITGPYPLEMTAGQFGFAVKNGDGAIVAEATNDADGNIVFPKLTFTETGIYNYTIVETSSDGNGFSTDKTVYEASVTVTDAGGGELAASVGYKAGSAPAFTNAYSPKSIEANFTASKIITGPYPLEMTAGQFGFAVKNGDGAIVAEATNDKDGNIVFPKLTFTETGLYNYTIVETSGDGNGFRTDKTIYEASVTVTDAGGGQLAASVSYKNESAPAFVNEYDPGSVDAKFTATKAITGSYPFGMTAGQFGFAVKNGDDIVIAEATNDADGNIVFPIMTFTEAGTYNYMIVETSLGGNGWTMDDTEYPVTVTITEDGSGELAAEVTYPDGDPVFVNTYEANISVEVYINTIQRTSAAYQNDDEDINNVNDEEFRYDIDFRSTSNVDLDTFTVEDVLAPEIRIQKLWTPVVWGDMDGKFDLSYKTNYSTDWILWETRSTDDVTPLDVADLGLASDEYITALQFKYGAVQAGFTSRNEDLAEQPALRNFSLMILMDLSSIEEVVTQPTELYPATYMVKAAYAMSSGSINASVTAVGTLGEKRAAADDNAVTEVIAPVNLAEIPPEQSAITEEGLVVNPPEVISGTTTTIEDDEVPLGSSVKTGDDRNLGLYAVLLAGSAAMLTGLWITGHKNRKRARSVMDTKGGAK